jgi:hypothetical protein
MNRNKKERNDGRNGREGGKEERRKGGKETFFFALLMRIRIQLNSNSIV